MWSPRSGARRAAQPSEEEEEGHAPNTRTGVRRKCCPRCGIPARAQGMDGEEQHAEKDSSPLAASLRGTKRNCCVVPQRQGSGHLEDGGTKKKKPIRLRAAATRSKEHYMARRICAGKRWPRAGTKTWPPWRREDTHEKGKTRARSHDGRKTRGGGTRRYGGPRRSKGKLPHQHGKKDEPEDAEDTNQDREPRAPASEKADADLGRGPHPTGGTPAHDSHRLSLRRGHRPLDVPPKGKKETAGRTARRTSAGKEQIAVTNRLPYQSGHGRSGTIGEDTKKKGNEARPQWVTKDLRRRCKDAPQPEVHGRPDSCLGPRSLSRPSGGLTDPRGHPMQPMSNQSATFRRPSTTGAWTSRQFAFSQLAPSKDDRKGKAASAKLGGRKSLPASARNTQRRLAEVCLQAEYRQPSHRRSRGLSTHPTGGYLLRDNRCTLARAAHAAETRRHCQSLSVEATQPDARQLRWGQTAAASTFLTHFPTLFLKA